MSDITKNYEQTVTVPDFSKHIPQLLQAYTQSWEKNGPGLLGVAFDSSNGGCMVSYHTEDCLPENIKLDMFKFQESHTPETQISFIIFHDVGTLFHNGQLRCFANETKT